MKRKTFNVLTILAAGLGIILLGGLSFVGIKSQGFKNWDFGSWYKKESDGCLLDINGDGVFTIEAEDEAIDRSNWELRADFIEADRGCVEEWTTSTSTEALEETSGYSLCGLVDNTIITIPIYVQQKMVIDLEIICAYDSPVLPSTTFSVEIDGESLKDNDTELRLGSGEASTYWNWKAYYAGYAIVEKGRHELVIHHVNAAINIDSFRIHSAVYVEE